MTEPFWTLNSRWLGTIWEQRWQRAVLLLLVAIIIPSKPSATKSPLCAVYCDICFTYFASFNFHSHLKRYILFSSYRLKKKIGFEKLSDVPKVTELGSLKVTWLPKSMLFTTLYSAKLQNTYFSLQSQNPPSLNSGDPSYLLEETFLI